MNRRTVLCGLTLGTVAVPIDTEGQPAGKVYRIGVLASTPTPHISAGPSRRNNSVMERREAPQTNPEDAQNSRSRARLAKEKNVWIRQ